MSLPAAATPISNAIATAEQQFGGEAYTAERYRENGRTFYEVEVLVGNQIVEAVLSGNGRRVIETDTYGSKRRVARAEAALERAGLSLQDAVAIAENTLGPEGIRGIREAEIRLSGDPDRNGSRFIVELRNADGLFDVVVNSRNGRVIRIRPD